MAHVGFESPTPHPGQRRAQQLSAHIVHLARATAERLDITSDFEISLLMSTGGDLPIFIQTFEKGVDHLRDRDDLTGIHKFQPVTGILAANIRPERFWIRSAVWLSTSSTRADRWIWASATLRPSFDPVDPSGHPVQRRHAAKCALLEDF